MKQRYGLRVLVADIPRLRAIAEGVGAVAPSGPMKGQPSVSTMLHQIASGELAVSRSPLASVSS